MTRRAALVGAALLCALALVGAPAAGAEDPPRFDGPAEIAAAPDYATERFADPWDYANIADVLIDPNGPTQGVANARLEAGRLVFDAVGSGSISPLFPGYPDALASGREGGNAPIDASRYTRASLHVYASQSTPASLMWFAGCRQFTDDCLGGRRFNLREGWNTYDLPLTNEFPGLPQEWRSPVYGLRLALNPPSSTRVELDWMRVYRPADDVRVHWTNPCPGAF